MKDSVTLDVKGILTCFNNILVFIRTVYKISVNFINSVVNPSAINTIRVGRTDDPTTPITITPTLSQPVELECDRQTTGKNWYTDGTIVTTTPGELATLARAGVKTLSISSFNPSHARGYTCTVNGGTSTAYPVLLGK